MKLSGQRICITGGGGFVGSHLAERLIADNDVVVLDRFSHGRREWVPDEASVVEGDLLEHDDVASGIDGRTDLVIHCAADKAVNSEDPNAQFRDNTAMTANVLERMEAVGCDQVAFTSSSTVYGEAPRPTPEDHAPLEPISMYGAAKLAEEGLLSVYAHSKEVQVWNFRFANIVGARLQLGAVIPDFISKLRQDPSELEILGDGRQEKSYMHVEDCVDAMCFVIENANDDINTYNLGTDSTISVTEIAQIVAEELRIDPEFRYTGGQRGWEGDVTRMRLDISKLCELGWESWASSDKAVRLAVRELLAE